MGQTISLRNSAAVPNLDAINPIKTGDRVTIWAAGATADSVRIMIGMEEILNGQINVEISADVVDTDRDFLVRRLWDKPTGDISIQSIAAAATNGYIIVVEGPGRL